ncbi:MAG: LysR family transcriptional regulator [Stackebrandtia sp.]
MDLEFRHLRTICAIDDAGSLSRAAIWLGVSQPALSAQLRRVERALGGELFVRDRSGVVPTALGVRTLRRARPILADFDAFIGRLDTPSADGRRVLRMGSAHMECVGTMITHVRRELPESEVRFQVEPSAVTLAQALEHNRMDMAVIGTMDDHDVPLAHELAHRTLVPRLPVFVAVSQAHPLAGCAAIELAELAGEAWICPPGADDGSLESLRTACRRAGFDARVEYEVPSGAGRQLIESGQAVQLVEPTSRALGGLVVRPLVGEPLRMRIKFAWRRGGLSPVQADRVYRAAARAYRAHASDHPVFAEWWAKHPQVHPFIDDDEP